MTFHVRAAENGSFVLTRELLQQIGVHAGDLLSVELEGSVLVVRSQHQPDGPLERMRAALRGYSVDNFLAERRADMGQ